MERFYCGDLTSADALEISEDQAHHAMHVLRIGEGQLIELFDGAGHYATARVRLGKKRMICQLEGPVQISAPPPFSLRIASAVPKLDRSDQLVDSASQLGAASLVWLDCQRSVVKPHTHGNKMLKWQRLAIESAKQCGRNHVLQIQPMLPLTEFLNGCREPILCACPRSLIGLHQWSRGPAMPPSASVLIGPEGGFSPQEMDHIGSRPGAVMVNLGPNILRIETAVAAAAAILGHLSTRPLS